RSDDRSDPGAAPRPPPVDRRGRDRRGCGRVGRSERARGPPRAGRHGGRVRRPRGVPAGRVGGRGPPGAPVKPLAAVVAVPVALGAVWALEAILGPILAALVL